MGTRGRVLLEVCFLVGLPALALAFALWPRQPDPPLPRPVATPLAPPRVPPFRPSGPIPMSFSESVERRFRPIITSLDRGKKDGITLKQIEGLFGDPPGDYSQGAKRPVPVERMAPTWSKVWIYPEAAFFVYYDEAGRFTEYDFLLRTASAYAAAKSSSVQPQ